VDFAESICFKLGQNLRAWSTQCIKQLRKHWIVVFTGFASVAPSLIASTAVPVEAKSPPLSRLEWEHIQKVLAKCGGNISETARRLGMHRRTLQRKLVKRPSWI
jgi:ActR/RegA family two-component response regulator